MRGRGKSWKEKKGKTRLSESYFLPYCLLLAGSFEDKLEKPPFS